MFYLLLGGLFISATSVAQVSKNVSIEKKGAVKVNAKVTPAHAAKDFENPIWESDFSNPDDWEVGNETGSQNDWVIGNEVPSGDFPIDGILSTTADNGYALYDSDLHCQPEDNAWIAMANSVDLGDYPVVAIQFETFYREYLGSCYVETSFDGDTWGNSLQILDIGTNNSTDNPHVVTLTIPGIGGNDGVYIRLRYEGACDYSWMVDDFKIGTPEDNDLALLSVYYDEYINFLELDEFLDVDYIQEIEHSQYMATQVRPLSFIADVENVGAQTQTGVILTASVETPEGTEEFSSDPVEVPAGERMYLNIPDIDLDAFANNGVIGEYVITYSITQDQEDSNPSNNVPLLRDFSVVEEFMGSDEATSWSVYYPTLGEDVIWASRAMFVQEEDINAIQFGVLSTDDAPSEEGEILFLNMRQGSVLETEDENNVMERFFGNEEIEYITTEEDFTTSEVTTWITYILPEVITVEPGFVYQAEVEIPVVGDDYLWIPFSDEQSEYTGLLFEYGDQSSGPQGWWTLGDNNPHIRMGHSGSIGVDGPNMVNFKMDQNYPNPVNGTTTIRWELLEPADNVFFFVSDINGKTVYKENMGSRAAGIQESIELDLNLAPGNYQYALQVGNHRIVRKMVVVE